MVGQAGDSRSGGGAIGIVSGSGINLRPILDTVTAEHSFSDVLGIAGAAVTGHAGLFVVGRAGNQPVVVQSGRIHLYEGRSLEEVGATVDALKEFGVDRIVFTNAVGGLRRELTPGALVAADRVVPWRFRAHQFASEYAPDFIIPDCDAVGACYWMHGPCYETRAEIRALQRLGASTVGMSLPPEMDRCRALNLPCAVVSCVTNDCTRQDMALTHAEVVETAARASERLASLLSRFIQGTTGEADAGKTGLKNNRNRK